MSDPIDIMAIAAVRHEQARAALLATGAMNAGPVAAMAGAGAATEFALATTDLLAARAFALEIADEQNRILQEVTNV